MEVAVARTNIVVRDFDFSQVTGVDGRRLEVVAEGLSLFGSAQLAIDATLVSALRGDGTARVGAHTPGAVLKAARRRRGVPDSLSSQVRSEDGGLLKQRAPSHRWFITNLRKLRNC